MWVREIIIIKKKETETIKLSLILLSTIPKQLLSNYYFTSSPDGPGGPIGPSSPWKKKKTDLRETNFLGILNAAH